MNYRILHGKCRRTVFTQELLTWFLIHINEWGKPEPSRKQSQTLNMNLEGERLDKNILIQIVNRWRLNFYQLSNQNIRPKVTECTGMLRCRLRMISPSRNFTLFLPYLPDNCQWIHSENKNDLLFFWLLRIYETS